MRKIEVCCSSTNEIKEAILGGAIRVELCGAISCGGVTPSYGLLKNAAALKDEIDINVIIRPREGCFLYSHEEVEDMCHDIDLCHELGLHGVVIGALTRDGDIDMEACRKMMEHAEGMSVTFHRAFDVCKDPAKALENIIELGCERLLTSGQQSTALIGAKKIADLIEQANGRIIIMPGAGIRPTNIAQIEKMTQAEEFHSTARITLSDGMIYRSNQVSFAVSPDMEGLLPQSDHTVISELVNNVL